MPHIVMEYSENLDGDFQASKVLEIVNQLVADCGLFSPEAVKARAVCYQDYVLPAGGKNFLHITTHILSGRPLEKRQELNRSIFDTVKTAMPHVDKLSCNIREMDREVYIK